MLNDVMCRNNRIPSGSRYGSNARGHVVRDPKMEKLGCIWRHRAPSQGKRNDAAGHHGRLQSNRGEFVN